MPGCAHRLHVTCLINCAQYDARCPVCRTVGEGVVRKPEEAPAIAGATFVLNLDVDAMQREWRRYTARRRRVLRQRPALHDKVQRLRDLRAEVTRAFAETQRVYDRKCREAWRDDPEVRAARAHMDRLRRRERRLEHAVDAELEALLGPEP
jgi:hypothetical protein